MSLLKKCLAGVFAVSVTAAASVAQAADFPSKPITIVVPYAAGGSNDLIARVVGAGLEKQLGVTVVVDNAPGASGTIGANRVINAQADGYTMLLGSPSEVAIASQINPNIKYDGVRDLSPVGKIGSQPLALVANPKLGIKSVQDFIDRYKDKDFGYGTSGIGTPLHLAGELIAKSGVKMFHVPYKGGAPALADIMGGQVEGGVLVFSTVLPHVRSGALQAIAVTSAKRTQAAPEIPALAENSAFGNVDVSLWFGLWTPANTDPAITQKLTEALSKTLEDKDVFTKLADAGITVEYNDPKTFGEYIKAETVKFGKIAADANVKLD